MIYICRYICRCAQRTTATFWVTLTLVTGQPAPRRPAVVNPHLKPWTTRTC